MKTLGTQRYKPNEFACDIKKACSNCKQWLSLELFNRNSARYNGYSVYCRNCANTLRKKNPSYIAANTRRATKQAMANDELREFSVVASLRRNKTLTVKNITAEIIANQKEALVLSRLAKAVTIFQQEDN